ncbi:hypothetical protein OBBRIDRAFT_775150 [Obba rivulosa]|uniref:Uncharacterized protein n=1 Tax=Obba rivulosa TaxID=1052685 RepID=A0A8E2AVN4_9APHY|nr:hypothetical protein OBBRIDRAFT_775150 [Obba rivulosa]
MSLLSICLALRDLHSRISGCLLNSSRGNGPGPSLLSSKKSPRLPITAVSENVEKPKRADSQKLGSPRAPLSQSSRA